MTANLYVQRTAERTGAGFIAFLEAAFGAQVELRFDAGEMIGHAVLRLGETALELGEGAAPGIPAPAAFVLNADDADAMYAQALAAGATALFAPAPQAYGGRMGGVRDAWGNESVHRPALTRRRDRPRPSTTTLEPRRRAKAGHVMCRASGAESPEWICGSGSSAW